jgi:short/branched chain acyl-CoA dehydrogenase
MPSYDLTETQQEMRRSVREFAEEVIKPRAIELDEKEEFSVEIARRMGELGLLGVTVPEEYGGAGLDYLCYVIAVEELARVDGSHAATIAAGNSLGISPIYTFGNEEQKRTWLPRLCTGEALASFGLTEPDAGSDAGGTKTAARPVNGGWIINGSKIFITNSTTRHNKLMWRSSDTGELYFDDCRVPDSALLGKRGEGFHQMLETLDAGRLAIAAMGLGGAQGAYEMALQYAGERKQFGRFLNEFQVTQFKLASMATEIEAARNLLYKATWLRMEHRPFTKEAAMAKLYCSEVFKHVATEAVQIFGGYGLMKEYHVERFFRDQKLL